MQKKLRYFLSIKHNANFYYVISKKITKSIREVAKAFNQHQPKKINFLKLYCSCRGKCFEDARCKCYQNKQPCSSHCTNHLTGSNSKCKNISH